MDSPPTILVVDDDADLRDLMTLLLEDAGYRVLTARDGREALDQVSREVPAVVLLDMKMPVMDGWQFASTFRREHGQGVPLVVITAAEDARRTASEVGADGYLGKPFDLDQVLELVERHCRTKVPR